MLYQVREAQRAVLNPLSSWAEAMSQLYSNPYSPYAYVPFAPRMAAGFELFHRLGKEYEKPEWGLKTTPIGGQEVTVFERIEVSKPFCNLIKFERLLPAALKKREADRRCWWSRRCRATMRRCCATRCVRCCPTTPST